MVSNTSRGGVQKSAVFLFLALATAQAALAVPGFTPQRRVGYGTGDQWEPALSADGRGHIYILFPQYGAVSDCPGCTAPTIALQVSNDNGLSWEAPHPLLVSSTGQFDPQIVVDPVDKQTVYASWLQNNKHDVMVARSQDFGRTWYFAVAERSPEDADKPVLAVRGADVYVGFNHEQHFLVAASHDYAQNFSSAEVNPNPEPGWSLAGGATVDPSGGVYFSWTAYARQELNTHPVSIFVSRSADGGRSWNTALLDVSSAPPDCAAQGCEPEYLGAQIGLASDSAGTVYALWNAGAAHGDPERIYFSSSTTGGASWSAKADVSSAEEQVEHCFPAITAGVAGDVRIAWMDMRQAPLWNVFSRSSINGGATWSAEAQLSSPARGYDYVLPNGFKFPFGDYFSMAIDNVGNTHVVWGEGSNFKSPGSIWYAHGR
ncbi:MAG TPA: sialidase family protein [Candidatus Eremiobacteraceae bacterium]|nr:sialidase family protein [Candidatus Eremiobacteraceae bacterium]